MVSNKLRASKKLRIFGGITILAGTWLFFFIEYINGNMIVHGYAVFPILGVGTWIGARLLGFKP